MVLANVSTKTLAKIATYGAVGTLGGLIFIRYKMEDRARNAPFYKLAMKNLRQNPAAISVLGEPIREHGFDVGDNERNFANNAEARFKVSVKGPKDKGYMFFWAEKPENEKEWFIKRQELILKSQPDKVLLLKKDESQ